MSIQASDWIVVAPFLTLSALGVVILMVGAFFPRIYRETLAAIMLLGLAVAMLFALQNWGEPHAGFWNTIAGDKLGVAFSCIFIIAASLTLLLSLNALENSYVNYADYLALVVFATAGMVLMASSTHLLTIFLGLETLSIALYVLAGFRRDNPYSLESAFKYFLLGAFASGFLLYGIALLYGATGSADLTVIGSHIARQGLTSSMLLVIGLVLLFVGFGFKIAVFPFHMWAPDVYQGAPTPIAAFMATGSKAAGFAALIRVSIAVGNSAGWQDALWVIIVLTMTVGNIIALRQENLKRMLAYSSIAHAGYVMIGLLAQNVIGNSAILYYLLTYTFMNIGAFGVIAYLSNAKHEFVLLKDFKGLAYRRPFAAFAMAVFMFSLAGVPPAAGFMAKLYVFSAAMKAGYLWLVIFAVINSMISLYYYLAVVVQMFMKSEDEAAPATAAQQPAVALALALAVFAVIDLGIFPTRWIEIFQDMARSFM